MATLVFNIHDAKTNLSRIVDEKLGQLKGKIKVGDDFNAPLDDETLGLFEGS